MAPNAGLTNLTSRLPTASAAVWCVPDETGLIKFLAEHLAEAGDNKNFTPKTFRAAADHLEKTRTKLHKLQALVDLIMGISGWKWHPNRGADIDITTKDTWDNWVAKNPEGKQRESHAFHGTAASTIASPATIIVPRLGFRAAGKGFRRGLVRAMAIELRVVKEMQPAMVPLLLITKTMKMTLIWLGLHLLRQPLVESGVAAQSSGGHRKKSCLSNGAQGIVDLATAAEAFNGIFADESSAPHVYLQACTAGGLDDTR
ncbi:hypothetical protein B0H14DRAFT_2586179 [Mycena olivaceomarginata]|nr:hypothetical protein B0H14DRAFT_2586179 [Mycena olivaceomarginata]